METWEERREEKVEHAFFNERRSSQAGVNSQVLRSREEFCSNISIENEIFLQWKKKETGIIGARDSLHIANNSVFEEDVKVIGNRTIQNAVSLDMIVCSTVLCRDLIALVIIRPR